MRAVSRKRAAQNRAYEPIRFGVFDRDGYRCITCGAAATDVHHRKQRSLGGGDVPENLVSLCRACHSDVHDEPSLYMSLGLLLASWETIAQVPLWHNADGRWATPYGEGWDWLPVGVSAYMPMAAVLQLRSRLDARQRLFSLVHEAIPGDVS